MSSVQRHPTGWFPRRRQPELDRTLAALDFAKRLASGVRVSDLDRIRLRRAGFTDREVAEIAAAVRGRFHGEDRGSAGGDDVAAIG